MRKVTIPLNKFAIIFIPLAVLLCFSTYQASGQIAVNITLRVDMCGEPVDSAGVYVAGTFNGFDPTITQMTFIGDMIYETVVQETAGSVTKYIFLNGSSYVGVETVPAACGLSDGFGGFQRGFTVPPNDTMIDVVAFSFCDSCNAPIVAGCTDPGAVNYDSLANFDDGSCLYAVDFSVNMNCPDPDPGSFDTVFITGPFCNFCAIGFPLSDPDGNGIWTGTYHLPAGSLEFNYMVDNFTSQENLIDDAQNAFTCGLVTDFSTYAYRSRFIFGNTSINNTYGSCPSCPFVCTEPFNLDVQNISTTSAKITWEGTSHTSFMIMGNKLGSPPITFYQGLHEVTVFHLLPNTGYYWRVASVCDDTVIVSSITDTFYTNPVCQPPANFQVTNINTNSVTFNWTSSANALGYRIAVAKSPYVIGSEFVKTIPAPASSYVLHNLTPGTNYLWRMRALCSNEASSLSPVFSFSTANAPSAEASKQSDNLVIHKTPSLELAPNPAANQFTIMTILLVDHLQIIDMSGKVWCVMMQPALSNGNLQVDVSYLPQGVYFLRIESEGTTQIRRLVVAR